MCSALSCDSVGDISECIVVNAVLLPLFTTTLNLDLLSTCVLYKLSSQRTRQVFVGGGRGDSDDVPIPNWRATIRLLIILTSRTFRPGGLCQLLTRHRYHFNATMCISFVPDEDLHSQNVVRCSYLLRESLSTQLNSATLSTVMLVETVAEINPTEHNPIIGTQTHTYTWTHKYRVV